MARRLFRLFLVSLLSKCLALQRPVGIVSTIRVALEQKRSWPIDLELDYGIFQRGRSALRDLPDAATLDPDQSKVVNAVLLLLQGHGDAAHEVILGVTRENLPQAEYAATHRGQTNWTNEHPLSAEDDMIHSIIHRCEGRRRGEGNWTGWDNARYWAAGGPKRYTTLPMHNVTSALATWARQHAPQCVKRGVVVASGRDCVYEIVADDRRSILVEANAWDPFCFIDLLEDKDASLADELALLQQRELQLLLEYESKRVAEEK